MAYSAKRRVARAITSRTGIHIARGPGLCEAFEQETLTTLFERFDVDFVLDVGANAGQYATRLRNAVGYQGHIVSCEPVAHLAGQLSHAARRDDKWHIENVALSDEDAHGEIWVSDQTEFSSLHTLSQRAKEELPESATAVRAQPVRLRRGEALLTQYAERLKFRNAFVKLDTQGHDVPAFLGLGRWIEELVGVQTELAIEPLYEGSLPLTTTLDVFTKYGFSVNALFPINFGNFPRMYEVDCVLFNERRLQ